MGRKAKHTQEEVFAAANDIAARGQEVTATVLQAAIGGSMTTIYRHLDAWNAMRAESALPAAIAMPETVLAAFNQVWQIAAQEAAKEVAAVREKADSDVKAMAKRVEEAITTIENLESESEADEIKIEKLDNEISELKRMTQTIATATAKREASLMATMEQMKQQISEQLTLLANSHAEHESYRSDKSTQIEELKTTIEKISSELKKQSEYAATLSGENGALKSQIESQEQILKSAVKGGIK